MLVGLDGKNLVVKLEYMIKVELDAKSIAPQEHILTCSMMETEVDEEFPLEWTDINIKDELDIGPTLLQRRFPPFKSPRIDRSSSIEGTKSNDNDTNSKSTESKSTCLIKCVYLDNGKKVYSCKICKVKNHHSELMRHVRSHTGEKPFICDVCENQFRYLSALNRHKMSKHKINTYKQFKGRSKRVFKCDKCVAQFLNSLALCKHKVAHHQKSFTCDTCGTSLSSRSSLIVHMRIHNNLKPFACSECGSAFRTSSHLKRHKLFHTREKPFACTDCTALFRYSVDLKRHKSLHNGEKRFKCDLCDLAFIHSSNLKVHKSKHHKTRR